MLHGNIQSETEKKKEAEKKKETESFLVGVAGQEHVGDP
jgi:hypothetical protein